jgi:hypothetical protein
MKPATIAGAIAAVAICACAASAASPALSIEKAVALAQANLKERGLDREIHVVALTLEPESMMRSRFHWFARWSRSIPREDKKREIGLQINMDGQLVHVLKAPAEAQGRRRNQASILDLRGH